MFISSWHTCLASAGLFFNRQMNQSFFFQILQFYYFFYRRRPSPPSPRSQKTGLWRRRKKTAVMVPFAGTKAPFFPRPPEILEPAPPAAFLKNATKKGTRFGPLRHAKVGRPNKTVSAAPRAPADTKYPIFPCSSCLLKPAPPAASLKNATQKGGHFVPLRHAKGGRPGK
jgi:hypothetical protein